MSCYIFSLINLSAIFGNMSHHHQFYRGTAIVETKAGIILGESKSGKILLPGGRAKTGESRILAAIRELREETTLKATCSVLLFEYKDSRDFHKVLWVAASGDAKAQDDLVAIHYCDQSNISKFDSALTNATRNILNLFWKFKFEHEDLFKSLEIVNSQPIAIHKSRNLV
jgi:8-oxo-dGTP diphosphatase